MSAWRGRGYPPTLLAAYRIFNSSVVNTIGLTHQVKIWKAQTAIHLLNAGHKDVTTSVVIGLLDDLWSNRYISSTGTAGFGLNTTRKQFADGNVNPISTIYGFTTNIAMAAFLDAYLLTGNSTWLDKAEECLTTMLTNCWGYTNGSLMSVWYDDQPGDQGGIPSHVIHNINSNTLSALVRYNRYIGSSFDAAKLAGMKAMLSNQKNAGGVLGRWRYRDLTGTDYNDLGHHSTVLSGVLESGMTEASDGFSYMWSTFFNSNGTFNVNDIEVMGSTNTGPCGALFVLVQNSDWLPQATLVANILANSVDANGASSIAGEFSTRPDTIVSYALALAKYSSKVYGDGVLYQ